MSQLNQAESTITPFLTFEGQAEEAMNFYLSLFPNSEILFSHKYGPNEAGKEGTIMQALFSLNGQMIMCIDSVVKHGWTFTPAVSFYINEANGEQVDKLFKELSEGGLVFMPLQEYPFSKKFGWVQDRFGVSWQLNWAEG